MIKFIPYEVRTGFENMQIDSDLLDDAILKQSEFATFRLYGWKPFCVSLGRNQKNDFIDENFLKNNNIDIVRRLTGGRALFHADEITYSFVCPQNLLKNGGNVVESYKEISQILIEAFRKLDIELDFGGTRKAQGNFCMLVSTGADLCWNGKKLIGSAQYRKEGYILQHGSILYSYDRQLLEKIFREDVDSSHVTSINEINPNIKKEDILEVLRNVNLP